MVCGGGGFGDDAEGRRISGQRGERMMMIMVGRMKGAGERIMIEVIDLIFRLSPHLSSVFFRAILQHCRGLACRGPCNASH